MNSRWVHFAQGVLLAALCGLVFGCGNMKVMPMDKTGWKTHCIGRFLVDLPPDAKVRGIYKVWGNPIERVNEVGGSVDSIIRRREEELKASPHETKGAMFIRRIDSPERGGSLLSWDAPYSEDFLRLDSYMTGSEGRRVFWRSSLVNPAKEQLAIDFARDLSASLEEISGDQVPQGPGYCIDGGFLAGNEFRSESFTVGVTIPRYPGMNITLLATTQGEVDEETLLGRTVATEAAVLAQGAQRLRKGKRAAGDGVIPGEEYLMTAVEDGQKKYGFSWESPGKAESIAEPFMTVELQVMGQSVVDEEHPYQPAFKSDEEAVQLWDAVLNTLRPRPGAF